ncbi:ABC transporter permease [bacterium]|nr:ABC transporter permease [bacterium]
MTTSTVTSTPTKAPEQPPSGLVELWQQRHLLSLMVKRDCIGRYKGSLLGLLWPLINPLGHLLLYTFLFSVVLKVKFGTSGSTSNFALYLMAGLLPWGAFAEALARSSTVILEHPNLVKRVVFPLQILPLVTVLSALVTEAIAFLTLLAGVLLYNHGLPSSLIYLPLIITSQILLTAGISWFVASLSVYIRDIRHLIALGLSAWMYGTPIVYPATALPEKIQFILWLNPMAGIVMDYRRVVLEGLTPDWQHYGVYTAMAVIVCVIGFKFFEGTKKSFADVM